MKILIISNLFPPDVVGGYEILCAQVCEGLEAKGHSVSVLTTSVTKGVASLGSIAATTGNAGANAVHRNLELLAPFDGPVGRSRRTRSAVTRTNYRISRETIEAESPDLIFVWSQLRLSVGAARAAEASGIPVCYTMNDNHLTGYAPRAWDFRPRATVGSLLDRFVYASDTSEALRLENVTCISHSLAGDLSESGLGLRNAEVIHQGIPVRRFPAKDRPGDLHRPARLLYCGQLHPYKGPQTLIEAAERIGSRHGTDAVQVTLVGDGPMRGELEGLGKSAGVEVKVSGALEHEELPGVYRNHDVLAFTSIWKEPFGLTHLEAMASGTTVVSTATGGQAEFLEDGVNALLFPEGDAGALANQIERLMANPEMSARLARTARQRVEERFSLERYVNDLDSWLHEVKDKGAMT